jgi:sugar phosphate permease
LAGYGIYYFYPTYLQEEMKYDKETALNIFSFLSIGNIVGNVLMGFISDILPLRSPVFEIGIFLTSISLFSLT